MLQNLKLVVAQINPVVGDISGNRRRIERIWKNLEGTCDLIVFPEMVYTGYPLEDLVFRERFIKDVRESIEDFAAHNKEKETAVLIGAPWKVDGQLYNAAFLIEKGHIHVILKCDLPNDGVFDEARIFANGPLPEPVMFRGHKLGIMICQDFWAPKVAKHLRQEGAEILIVPNGSTFETEKYHIRVNEASKRVRETRLPLLYVNLIGGQDELVFDGASFLMSSSGEVVYQLKAFEEEIAPVVSGDLDVYPETNKAMYQAVVLGLRDYVLKSGFQTVLLGLSGGIDSALTAVIAADALGPENVHAVLLPSRFTSDASNEDAIQLAENLGISYEAIPIAPAMAAFEEMIDGLDGLAHENMQARARGLTLMSLSNKTGALLLSTGNKSELAAGYATLYGDMCGAFNPLKDMYKTKVFQLALLRNLWKPDLAFGAETGQDGSLIPERIIVRPPTAELRENQKDEDSLPPYDVLDQILERMIEGEDGQEDIINDGFQRALVQKVYKMLHGAEYKRRQACPGVNLTTKSFGGRSRRYPIVNRY